MEEELKKFMLEQEKMNLRLLKEIKELWLAMKKDAEHINILVNLMK